MSVGDARPVQPGGWYGRTAAALRRPWGQALTGLALIGLLALLYLNQVASVAVANARLGNLRAEQTQLEQQNSQLHQQLGELTSPAYVDRRARPVGPGPDPPGGGGGFPGGGAPRGGGGAQARR